MDERRLLCVHAHPDDESSKGAATLASYARLGRVRVVTCTGGERGDILNPLFDDAALAGRTMAQLRREEMAAAARILGIEHVFLGFVDSGLPEGYPDVELPADSFARATDADVHRALVAQIREFRPQVVTTYDENGGYPHPDHLRTHTATLAAVRLAGEPCWPELGKPWQVSKLYYDANLSFTRLRTLHEAILAAGQASPFTEWLTEAAQFPRPRHAATTRVDVVAYFPLRDAAMRAHASQIDPNGLFFAAPRELEAQVWPHEDFYLAASTVGPAPAEGETDLFARVPGLESEEQAAARYRS
ncbi:MULTISPECIES: mycothiol conjugate amidase Mca [Actinotignum]|nr:MULTISPECIES: mycothiol conjugate amidase Mca [Actinotignum]MDE1536812.1 mycothiol conjugate amidase Mca [Actinotignum schaalii]MDE1553512.1 mycothiol conjugate amidase Mca [Actinotignum sanguinis]MDE1566170.1 mycothiol conjugate amidase Mca [Actinotignum sanguinis]MDE1577770.1 mycothiol conjugate amidase Mca [Actinotignum sanguinis]MDE1642982.1 mycothiol conjugate amidase Mca [Actinotignum sanguinis]